MRAEPRPRASSAEPSGYKARDSARHSVRGGLHTAGIGALIPGVATLAVVRFEPQTQTVHVGDTVTWSNLRPEFPHTVTFGTEPGGGPFGTFLPSGFDPQATPGHATLTARANRSTPALSALTYPLGRSSRPRLRRRARTAISVPYTTNSAWSARSKSFGKPSRVEAGCLEVDHESGLGLPDILQPQVRNPRRWLQRDRRRIRCSATAIAVSHGREEPTHRIRLN